MVMEVCIFFPREQEGKMQLSTKAWVYYEISKPGAKDKTTGRANQQQYLPGQRECFVTRIIYPRHKVVTRGKHATSRLHPGKEHSTSKSDAS